VTETTIIVPKEDRILMLVEEELTIEVPGEIREIEVERHASR
jgi:hypothetical protein